MTDHFEVRHRALREEHAAVPATEKLAETDHDIISRRLIFDDITGPLVDDLIAADRELRDAPRDGSVDIAALTRKQHAALDALDEASRG